MPVQDITSTTEVVSLSNLRYVGSLWTLSSLVRKVAVRDVFLLNVVLFQNAGVSGRLYWTSMFDGPLPIGCEKKQYGEGCDVTDVIVVTCQFNFFFFFCTAKIHFCPWRQFAYICFLLLSCAGVPFSAFSGVIMQCGFSIYFSCCSYIWTAGLLAVFCWVRVSRLWGTVCRMSCVRGRWSHL